MAAFEISSTTHPKFNIHHPASVSNTQSTSSQRKTMPIPNDYFQNDSPPSKSAPTCKKLTKESTNDHVINWGEKLKSPTLISLINCLKNLGNIFKGDSNQSFSQVKFCLNNQEALVYVIESSTNKKPAQIDLTCQHPALEDSASDSDSASTCMVLPGLLPWKLHASNIQS
ncbi:alphaK I4 [Puccinia sorghi]|uniref:AlphaK I4 n=1 Tax=Puccinia sorghi TaxID=27349 RepID=A0A0L6V3I0_9BASI|nr:alphaK I4 [Puccinia sorghi]